MSRHEYPIVSFWYTKYKGRTIEWIIDHDPEYFIWMVKTFQDVTPSQAEYFFSIHKRRIKDEYIQDVEPYEWVKGDPVELYEELCITRDLESAINKWRVRENRLF